MNYFLANLKIDRFLRPLTKFCDQPRSFFRK